MYTNGFIHISLGTITVGLKDGRQLRISVCLKLFALCSDFLCCVKWHHFPNWFLLLYIYVSGPYGLVQPIEAHV
jgi:hypothetical protein